LRFLARCTVLLLACLAGWQGSSRADETRERGRALTRLFFSSQLDSLRQSFNGQMAEMFDLKRLDIFRHQVEDQLGSETQLVDESIETNGGMTVYKRLANFAKYPASSK
jgi:hypothetical protein